MTMTLENNIKEIIASSMEDGTVEKLVKEQMEKGIKNALENLFRSYGDVTKVIEEKVKSVMIPYLENYDYSEYIVKLDDVLVNVLKSSALENKKLLENFKELMIPEEKIKVINMSDLYERWMEHVAEEVKTDDLKVCYDDGVSYEDVDVSYEVEYEDGRRWSDFEYATVYFECEQDEELNFSLKIHRWKNHDKEKEYTIDYDKSHDLKSLRSLSKFEIYLMKLKQDFVKLKLDEDASSDEVTPKAEPEATYS